MYKLPDLPYAYDALAPTIGAEIMELHHKKHHQSYVDKLNAALQEAPELSGHDLVGMLSSLDSLPEGVRSAVRNHGGGHYNHSLFWNIMSPQGGGTPTGVLLERISERYGSFDEFVSQFNTKAAGLFGSGWVWLTRDMETIALPNQDTPMALGRGEPIMGLDVWEHAYYLDYKNVRADYIEAWWNVVDWGAVGERYGE